MPAQTAAPVKTADGGRTYPRRPLILCAFGAVIGLVIAGLGLFGAAGTRTASVPAEDAALVNQVPILMRDYAAQVWSLYGVPLAQATPAERRRPLDDMIREELYVQRAIELGMQNDTTEVRTALVGALEGQIAAEAVVAQPTETDLRAFFRNHAARYADEGVIALSEYILTGHSMDRAEAAVAALRRGVAAAVVAARYGMRRSTRVDDGGEFYFAARIHLGDRLFHEASTRATGQISNPVPMQDGIHILVIHSNKRPAAATFADARDRALNDYTSERAKLLTDGNDRFLRKRADVQVQAGLP